MGGAVAVLLLTLLLASIPRPSMVEIIEGPPVPVATETAYITETLEPIPEEQPFELPDGEPLDLPDWLPDLLRLLATGAVLLLIALFLHRLWQARVRAQRATAVKPSGEWVEIIDLDEEELVETITEAVQHLRRGIPVEGAVIECWRRLEGLAADTGIRRLAAQTSHEFTAQVLGRAAVDPDAINELADLYRQAMFSTHSLTDDDRERAIRCLESLSGQLKGSA